MRRPTKIIEWINNLPKNRWRHIKFLSILGAKELVIGVTPEALEKFFQGSLDKIEREGDKHGRLKIKFRLRDIDLKITIVTGEVEAREVEEAEKEFKEREDEGEEED